MTQTAPVLPMTLQTMTETISKMKRKVTVLIDADPLVYRVGFSLEKRIWTTRWVNVVDGKDTAYHGTFDNAARRDEYVRLMNLHPDEYEHTLVPVPTGDEAIVYGRTKQSITDIEKNVGEYLKATGQEVGELRLFLTGTDNFRNEVGTILKYKGNRDNAVRPYWYNEIREYLIKYWAAEVVDGMEADDAVSILQWQADEGETIICSIDKDLENVPGHFYNYHKKEARYISYGEGMLNFYRQILTGDNADNIPGCYKIGKKGAEKLMPEYTSEVELWDVVVQQYAINMEKYPEHHMPYSNDPVGAATENGKLLWMLSEVGENWEPPV